MNRDDFIASQGDATGKADIAEHWIVIQNASRSLPHLALSKPHRGLLISAPRETEQDGTSFISEEISLAKEISRDTQREAEKGEEGGSSRWCGHTEFCKSTMVLHLQAWLMCSSAEDLRV